MSCSDSALIRARRCIVSTYDIEAAHGSDIACELGRLSIRRAKCLRGLIDRAVVQALDSERIGGVNHSAQCDSASGMVDPNDR